MLISHEQAQNIPGHLLFDHLLEIFSTVLLNMVAFQKYDSSSNQYIPYSTNSKTLTWVIGVDVQVAHSVATSKESKKEFTSSGRE